MRKKFVVFLHLGYWLLYLLLFLLLLSVASVQLKKTASWSFVLSAWPLILFSLVPNLLAFYLSYFLLFTRYLKRQRFLALIAAGVGVCLLAAFAGGLFSSLIFGFGQPVLTDAGEFFALFASLFLIAAVHSAVALVIRGFITWYAEIRLKQELARKNFETELALVKSQINPHFLFNTLNNIDVLIAKDPALASRYLNGLADILRYMVYETKAERIELARELDYLEKYLELQKIRTVHADYVDYRVSGAAGNRQIAPMILFPFIENAFKHTENNRKSNAIRIGISIAGDEFVFECENTYQAGTGDKQDFGGLGNALVKRRLRLTYPEKHLLEIADDGKLYRVKLRLYEN